MTTRIHLSLAAIALAAALVSCSSGGTTPPSPGVSQNAETSTQGTTDTSTPTVAPDITGEPNEPSTVEATVPVEEVKDTGEEAVPAVPETADVKDGPTKKNLTYVAEKLTAYISTNGVPSTEDGITGIAGDLPDFEDETTDIAYMVNPDGSWLLRAWNSTDGNYRDFNSALTYHSVNGFVIP